MLEINEKKYFNDEKDFQIDNNNNSINYFLALIEDFPKIKQIVTDKIEANQESLLYYLKNTEQKISTYLNEINNPKKINKINNKKTIRYINYLIKLLRNKSYYSINKTNDDNFSKTINKFFILFIFNLLKSVLIVKNNNNNKNITICHLNYILNNILDIIGLYYIGKIINDEYFEELLKFLLYLSLAKKLEKKPKERDEIINMMFFSSCINVLKIIFSKLFDIQKEYTERQEELLNNIIIYINKNILGYSDIKNNQNYINKVFLSKNDCKTSLLIELTHIVSKTKLKSLKDNFINLISEIYCFSFKYNNCMRPTLQLLEPLFININKKEIDQIKYELNVIDSSLSFIKSLIDKENNIKKHNTCMLKQGFYFNSELGGIVCEFNSLENDFIIMFGFQIEDNELDRILLFDILNTKNDSSLIKFCLIKTYNNNSYEMLCEQSNETSETTTKINIIVGKTYIFSFHFKIKGMMQSSSIKINYVRDELITDGNESKPKILSGMDLKLKNFKNENLSLYIGREISGEGKNFRKIKNKFKGFIGDIIILNTKNIKNKLDLEFKKYLLYLEGNYSLIFSLITENLNEFQYTDNNINDNNPNYIELKEQINRFVENENKLFKSIKMIISPKIFSSIEYQDDIDYMNHKNNYDYYQQKKSIIFKLKKNYLDTILKPDTSEDKKIIKLFSSLFDKNFHIFENKSSVIEFMKCEGINYLSLLLEYYYQIINCLLDPKNKFKNEDIKNINKEIYQNISNLLNFFNVYIIKNNYHFNYKKETLQFFYQLSNTLLAFMEIDTLNIQIIKYFADMMNTYNKYINTKQKVPRHFIVIRNNLFDFLLNPKLFKEKDDSSLEKLNYVFINLLFLITINVDGDKFKNIMDIFTVKILNKLLNYIWLLDNSDNNKDIINKEKEDSKHHEILVEKTKENYIILLIEYLKLSYPKDKNSNKSYSDNNLFVVKDNLNEKDFKSSKTLILNKNDLKLDNNNNGEKEKYLINHFLDKIIENSKNKNIFWNMSIIFAKTNLIKELEESEIEKIKLLIIKELNVKCDKNNDNKKIIYLSCLLILIEYYFSECKSDESKSKKINKSDFHKFIRGLNLNLDFFYSLMSSIKVVKNLYINIDFEINNNTKTPNKNSLNYENEIKELEKYYTKSFSGLIFMEININSLSVHQSNIIISILEDIIYLLYKLGKKYLSNIIKKDSKNNDSFNSSLSSDQNILKDIYEILKKNIDIIFRYPDSELYKKLFSFENEICAELFYLKWKIDGEEGQNYIEKAIMKYHKDLLKNYCSSFIFKFLFFITNENVLPLESFFEEDTDKYKNRIIKLRINLMIYIIETLFNYNKEIKEKNEMINHMINLLNFLILINEELDYNQNILFKNSKFCEALYKFISLLEKTGLLYSNYYIELNNNYGRTVCEIIYDLFFVYHDNDFREEIFSKIFTKINHQEKEIFTIFYLIDIYKGAILDKEINVKKKLYTLIPELVNLNLFQTNYINKRKKKNKLFLNKNLYPLEEINFCIYFLGKSFIYFDSNIMKSGKNEFKNYLLQKFLPLLSKNIFRLYTKRNNFYGKKRCHDFPLYFHTKKYFESYLIQNPNNFKKYESFFKTDMKVNLKKEYSIYYCYSSRLLHDIQKEKKGRELSIAYTIEKTQKSQSFYIPNNIDLNNIIDISSDISNSSNNLQFISTKYKFNSNLKDLALSSKSLTIKSFEEFDNNKSSDDLQLIEEKKENNDCKFYCAFEGISKINNIYNPTNIFFKKIFSESFKNIIFNDKTFKKIKNTFLIKYKNNNIFKESKQMNYPSRQKNYSNFLEPMIFLRRDFNFYNKTFFPVSHNYINDKIIEKNYENIHFYRHKYKYIKEEANKSLFCELVTRQYIYFGKMFFFDNYIIFESCADPRNKTNNNYNEYEIFLKYSISTKNRDNTTTKNKIILLFIDDIKEVIKRRTLLLNNSIEILNKNGKSYFFNFFRIKEIEKVYQYINEINEKLLKLNLKKFDFKLNYEDALKNTLHSFRLGKISVYEYLLYLNKYSTRTYNDLSQYPIFPWLVLEHDKIEQIFSSNNKNLKTFTFIRDLNYPISVQTEKNRNSILEKNKVEEEKFTCQLYRHYSTAGYIYYYLMRINPYEENMITFQDFKLENSNRIFHSFKELEIILKEDSDNRELIPDFFCYCDYFCNLNCSYFGKRNGKEMIDDIEIKNNSLSRYANNISSYIYFIYREKKLLNSFYISKRIHKWVDIIFGKNQLPSKKEDALKSCNIYSKSTYEQKINFEKKFNKYEKLINQKQFNKKDFIEKMKNKLDMTLNFGQTPKQILKESNIYEGENKLSTDNFYKVLKSEEKIIFFKKFENYYLIIKDEKKTSKNRARIAIIYNKNFKSKESSTYDCKSLNLFVKNTNFIINEREKKLKVPLYHPEYAISLIHLNKLNIPIILTCRYYGNYFLLQSKDKHLKVFCEDYVTSIKGLINSEGNNFFTGLSNGKLIEWKIVSYLKIEEVKHIYCHNSAITVIEIYHNQNVIITAGEDKYIYIRKLYDFELLTVIDLTYSFGNPIISQNKNIFPSLIQVSELNLLYILLYDLDSKKSIIRGYNLNGLFFAQTDDKYFKEENYNLLINNISFTKNANLVVGFYNSNKYAILQAWGLQPMDSLKNLQITELNQNKGTKLVKYDYSQGLFYILFDNLFIIMTPKDINEQQNLDSF